MLRTTCKGILVAFDGCLCCIEWSVQESFDVNSEMGRSEGKLIEMCSSRSHYSLSPQ